MIAQKLDKFFLFKRNVSIFSNVALHCFWDTRASYTLPNFIYRGILLCCGGNYYYRLQQLHQIITL